MYRNLLRIIEQKHIQHRSKLEITIRCDNTQTNGAQIIGDNESLEVYRQQHQYQSNPKKPINKQKWTKIDKIKDRNRKNWTKD